jgi:hypothetical protein
MTEGRAVAYGSESVFTITLQLNATEKVPNGGRIDSLARVAPHIAEMILV